MDFMTLAKKRCSVRAYRPDAVEQEKLDVILEAGRIAPTAANRQPQRILVIRSEAGLEKLKTSARVYGAPLALVVCADHAHSWKRSFDGKDAADIDATIATTHMMLVAADLGLDSIWVCHFDPDGVRTGFGLPGNVEPVNILGIGYAEGPVKSPDRHAVDRMPQSEIVVMEHF